MFASGYAGGTLLPQHQHTPSASMEPGVVVVLNIDQVEHWNVCDELRLICSDIPVVILTAAISPTEVNRRRARRSVNCAAFVGKPCSAEELAAVIERVLGGERAIEQTIGKRRVSDG